MKTPKRIIIVGHMGAGKSLLGKTLAEKLGWEHVDANIGIERYIGRTLPNILGTAGQETFFECQRDILSQYLKKPDLIITTDDGFILNEDNRKLLEGEFVLYLKVSTPTQIERMSISGNPKALDPNLKLNEFLDNLHNERDKLYEAIASYTLESKSLDADANTIIKEIS